MARCSKEHCYSKEMAWVTQSSSASRGREAGDVDGITGNEVQMLNCTAQTFPTNMLQGNGSGL